MDIHETCPPPFLPPSPSEQFQHAGRRACAIQLLMDAPSKFSVNEIELIVSLAQASGDLTESELGGMTKLVELLRALERLSDADLAKIVQDHFERRTR